MFDESANKAAVDVNQLKINVEVDEFVAEAIRGNDQVNAESRRKKIQWKL